jgi:hypothetical protein
MYIGGTLASTNDNVNTRKVTITNLRCQLIDAESLSENSMEGEDSRFVSQGELLHSTACTRLTRNAVILKLN